MRTPLMLALLLSVGLATGLTAGPAVADGDQQQPVGDVRHAVFVGNNWDGTATILDPQRLEQLGRINIVPDKDARMAEIALNPYRLAYFLAIRELIGEGHDQFVDDLYTSNDGRLLVVSRPSFADVVAISLESHEIVWRFPSGGSPHESIYFKDGTRILHASIGMVYSPLDDPALDSTKDDRVLQVVDAETFEVLRRIDVRKALDARGMTTVSSAVRPLSMTPDSKFLYFQLSFFHGFVEMRRRTGEITRVRVLPDLHPEVRREQYLLDSAHHGIAVNPSGTKICVAATMSDYATVVRRDTFKRGRLLKGGEKPYWVTPSRDGRYCYISWSGSDTISRISYRTGRLSRTVPVGDHPQRIRTGFIHSPLVAGLPDHTPDVS